MNRTGFLQKSIVIITAVGALHGCGGASQQQELGTVPASVGQYLGPNTLTFLITSPVRREMPPEQLNGMARVLASEDGGSAIRLELQMMLEGEPCMLNAAPNDSGSYEILAGQDCRARFAYYETPTAAVVRVNEGTAEFSEDGALTVELEGLFAAASQGGGEHEGIATWTFSGRRQP